MHSLDDALTAASALLGWRIVRIDGGSRRVGRIVETEAYPHDDPACHAYGGKTRRNASMFRRAGHAYVYRIHRSFCFNIVTGPEGRGEAVLIRAIEPLEGIERMMEARARLAVGRKPASGAALTNGPGKLCQALDIDSRLDGHWLLSREDGGSEENGVLRIESGDVAGPIRRSTRIGISKAKSRRYRFFLQDNGWLSR